MGQPNETTDSLGPDTGTTDAADIRGAETQQPEEFNGDTLAVGEACLDPLPELASDTADLTPPVVSSAELREQIAELSATLPELHDAVAQTSLAAYGSPKDRKLAKAAAAALKALRDATDQLAQLTAAAELVERQEKAARDQIAAEKLEAEKAKARKSINYKQDLNSARYLREEAAQKADQEKLDEFLAEHDWHSEQLAKLNLQIPVYRSRIASRSDRMGDLIDEFAELEEQLAAIDAPSSAQAEPVEPAEVDPAATAEAEEIARRAAELEEQSAREMRRLQAEHDSEHVEVDVPFATVDGIVQHHSGKRRMQRRYVADHEAQMAALAARLGQRPVEQRPTRPWVALQGPPHSLGLEAAVRSWLRGATHEEIQYVHAAAVERNDKQVIALLESRL
jgi:hypothetical protein